MGNHLVTVSSDLPQGCHSPPEPSPKQLVLWGVEGLGVDVRAGLTPELQAT